MKRRSFLSALLALPVAPLAIKGLSQETPAPAPETDFPEGYRTFVNMPNRVYVARSTGTIDFAHINDAASWSITKIAANV